MLGLRLGSIPVRIHGSFLLVTVLLGAGNGHGEIAETIAVPIWVAVVFFSILVHELGHALMGKAFGLSPQIDLHGMGGTTSWISGRNVGNLRSIAISLAGPFAGFVIGALVVLAVKLQIVVPASPVSQFAVSQLKWVNIGWGVINLLPLMPLDGGNAMRAFLNAVTKGRGDKPALVISIVFCVLVLGVALFGRDLWLGLLGGIFLTNNVRGFRALGQAKVDGPLVQAIEGAYRALERHDGSEAIRLLRPTLVTHASEELRGVGLRVFAYALLIEGHWAELLPLLERERTVIGNDELGRFARTARELGRLDEASRIETLLAPT